jgi:hypothetical protein
LHCKGTNKKLNKKIFLRKFLEKYYLIDLNQEIKKSLKIII